MRRGRIKYSTEQMRWLEANRMMVISDYHSAFVAQFGRMDISAAHLHSLRKRKGWKVGRAPERYIGRGSKYSAEQIAWLSDNRTLPLAEYCKEFCAAFPNVDVTAEKLHSLRKRKRWKTGRTGRFDKGSTPANKGKKMPFNANSARTQFKRGHRGGIAAKVYKPIGAERMHESGCMQRKIHNGLPMQSRWKFVHRIEWEAVNGPVPDGMVLKCLGEKTNCHPSNWELVPRGMLPRLNGKSGRNFDAAPAELKPTIMAVAKLEHHANQKRRASA